jgi:hypothetical protein
MDTTIQGKSNTFQVIKPLKSGGRGEVLLARDDMDRRVAIKRPFASFADGLERFELEAPEPRWTILTSQKVMRRNRGHKLLPLDGSPALTESEQIGEYSIALDAR